MKTIKFMALLMLLGTGWAVTSCSDDDEAEESDNYTTITFEGSHWDSLIDSEQYNGELLYGPNANQYSWTDEETSLQGGMTNSWGGYYGFSEGGTAISNYIDALTAEHSTYDYQLSVPVSNGSQNFVIAYCPATVTFSDGVAREIKSMQICPTTYLLGIELYGSDYASALTEEGSYMTLTITADTGATLDMDFARDGDIVQMWKTVDLSQLGKVTSLFFSMDGSDSGDWGLNTPAYFAFDNVVVGR
ncbi:MAG: DUF4465 domain-containing protein [Prevotellaceae bacterium]|nr:DUF4465 domain-containing protein [Prevotellaceae bacterium]